MATNYLVNVPKLKGRENYNEWTFAAQNFLILEDKLHCIKLETGKLIEAADDARTKAKLIMTIDSALYVHIKDVKTSLELWNKLKALFDDSGFTRRIFLLRASMHLTANEDWIENPIYHKMKDICVANSEKLQVLCSGDVTIVTKTDEFNKLQSYDLPLAFEKPINYKQYFQS
ncbi:unnamed protein product [Euphydryas editha]|uniref:Uncharacterized protein n=1 Tax=Euphydryas editha TaxID=104508 RepID=A0AAU9TZJ5_EUPED|nr:unnamed protein product [Euphydryas editha]